MTTTTSDITPHIYSSSTNTAINSLIDSCDTTLSQLTEHNNDLSVLEQAAVRTTTKLLDDEYQQQQVHHATIAKDTYCAMFVHEKQRNDELLQRIEQLGEGEQDPVVTPAIPTPNTNTNTHTSSSSSSGLEAFFQAQIALLHKHYQQQLEVKDKQHQHQLEAKDDFMTKQLEAKDKQLLAYQQHIQQMQQVFIQHQLNNTNNNNTNTPPSRPTTKRNRFDSINSEDENNNNNNDSDGNQDKPLIKKHKPNNITNDHE